jgi:hypothetical protein
MTTPSQLTARHNEGRTPCIDPYTLAAIVRRAARKAAADGKAWTHLRRELRKAGGREK